MTLSGLEVLSTLTTDSGKILAKLTSVQPKGELCLIPGIKIAHLALKHRLGKNHKMRIVAFIGSPIEADEKDVIKLAKKLKKEKVNVDVISFGEVDVNEEILKKFIETVNGRDGTGSHLVAIPPGPHLSDALISSPILQSEDGSGPTPGTGFEFGVDPNEDPELALALRVSMEEQRARQEAQTGGEKKEPDTPAASTAAAATESSSTGGDDEKLLQRALEMSMAEGGESAPEPDLASMTEEEQIAYAMRMSMQDSEKPSSAAAAADDSKMDVDEKKEEEEDYSEVMNDPAFLQVRPPTFQMFGTPKLVRTILFGHFKLCRLRLVFSDKTKATK